MSRFSRLVFPIYSGIILIIYLNLNGIATLAFKLNAPFSVFLLPLCLAQIVILQRYIGKSWIISCFYIFFSLYLLLSIAAAILYYDPAYGKQDHWHHIRGYLPTYITVLTFYVTFRYAIIRSKLLPFLRALFWCCIIASAATAFAEPLGLAQKYFAYASADAIHGHRDGGFFRNPNAAGVHLNITLVLSLFLYLYDPNKFLKYVYFLAIGISLYGGFVTFSKSTILISALLLVLFVYYSLFRITRLYGHARKRAWLINGFFILAVWLGSVHLMSSLSSLTPGQQNRLGETLLLASGTFNEQTTTYRSIGWQIAIDKISKNPITGFGLGSFHRMPDFKNLGVHNVYLMLFGESGFVPILLLLCILAYVAVKISFRMPNKLLSFLLLGLFIVVFIQLYGSGHTGLRNQEANGVIGLLLAFSSFKKWSH